MSEPRALLVNGPYRGCDFPFTAPTLFIPHRTSPIRVYKPDQPLVDPAYVEVAYRIESYRCASGEVVYLGSTEYLG